MDGTGSWNGTEIEGTLKGHSPFSLNISLGRKRTNKLRVISLLDYIQSMILETNTYEMK
jgi:hypothetical protein